MYFVYMYNNNIDKTAGQRIRIRSRSRKLMCIQVGQIFKLGCREWYAIIRHIRIDVQHKTFFFRLNLN